MPHDSPGTLVYWCRKSWQNSNRVTPTWGAKYRWGRLNANWQLSTWSVVSLVRSQVYHTEPPPYLFAARSPWCSLLCGFFSDSWSLLEHVDHQLGSYVTCTCHFPRSQGIPSINVPEIQKFVILGLFITWPVLSAVNLWSVGDINRWTWLSLLEVFTITQQTHCSPSQRANFVSSVWFFVI